MRDCLMILQPRRIPAAIASIESLPIDQFWLTALTEPDLAPILNAFIRATNYRDYLIVSDDVSVTPQALACVRELLTRHAAATGYCRISEADARVNLTRSPLRPIEQPGGGTRIGWASYSFYTLDDVQRITYEFPSWFGGWALTGLRRELWLAYPFEVHSHSNCQTDAQTALRMARDGRFFISHRDAYVEHLKRDPNNSLLDGWLVGVEPPAARFVSAEGAA